MTVRSFFQYCDRGDLPVFKRVNVPDPVPAPLADDELKRLIEAASDPLTRLYIKTASSMGLAVVDMTNLTKTAVAESNGVLRYNRQKSGRAALPPNLAELRAELLTQPNEFIFWNRSLAQKTQINHWIMAVGAAFKAAGLDEEGKGSTHRLRDTCAKYCFDKGSNASEVALILGDLTTTVERHYREWASSWDERRIAALGARQFKARQF